MTNAPSERIDELYDGDGNLVTPISIDSILAELAKRRKPRPTSTRPDPH